MSKKLASKPARRTPARAPTVQPEPPSPAAHLAPYQWPLGQSGNPAGRKKGSRNKLGEQFISDLQADWEQHGAEAIETVRLERPHEYLKVVASILPKELNVRADPLEEIPDDELEALLAAARAALRAHEEGEADSIRSSGGKPH